MAIVELSELIEICSDRVYSAQRLHRREALGVSRALAPQVQVQYPCVLDLYLKMDALLNCYMEITLFIKFVCDKKVVIRVGSLMRL